MTQQELLGRSVADATSPTPVVYIAGPFRGKTAYDVHQNVLAAERRMHELVTAADAAGVRVAALCPHTMTAHFDGTLTDQYWLDATLELMRRCDAVVLCPNWGNSSGTRAEIEEAGRIGIPVFELVASAVQWAKDRSAS